LDWIGLGGVGSWVGWGGVGVEVHLHRAGELWKSQILAISVSPLNFPEFGSGIIAELSVEFWTLLNELIVSDAATSHCANLVVGPIPARCVALHGNDYTITKSSPMRNKVIVG
jgi:hypothetical protein